MKQAFIETHISSKKVSDVANVLAIIWDCEERITTSGHAFLDPHANEAQKKISHEAQASCRRVAETYAIRKTELADRVKARSDYAVDYTQRNGPLLDSNFREVYRRWLSATDAVYLNHLTRGLSFRAVTLKRINGRPLTPSDRSACWAGILLAGCDRGLPCDQRHWLVSLACVGLAHKCHGSLQELLMRDGSELAHVFAGEPYFDPNAAMAMKQRFLAGEDFSDL